MLNRMAKGKVYTQVDMYSGFWQIPLAEEDREKSAFITPLGLFEWVVMPFGLTNAPATFQSFMEKVLHQYLGSICDIYIDDLVIYSENLEEHVEHVGKVFDLLKAEGLRMKIEKCHFAVQEMNFLGFVVTPEGLRPQPDKAAKIVDAVVKPTQKGILKFVGLVRYYQRFVPDLATLAQPLTSLLRKENNIKEWGEEQEQAIREIKEIFKSDRFLIHFDPS